MNDRIVRGLGALAFGATLLTSSLATQAANLVTNGDFDNTSSTYVANTPQGGDDLQTAGSTMVPGWTAVTGHANDIWVGPNNTYGITASPGNGSGYFLDLTGQSDVQPWGGVEQTIATQAGATYTLSFDLGASTIYNGPGTRASALTASATGASLDASKDVMLAPSTSNDWAAETLTFTADSSSTTIEFLGNPAFSSEYIGLDNVNVSMVSAPPPVTSVPEPASFAMLLAGLAGVAGLARARRRS
jgi:hypothetical protein